MKRILLVAMSALLLTACASSGMHGGMVYRDGSWYSPAADGQGDYYTGTEHRHDYAYDWPWAWSVGFVPYGGYCPVQYRYCTSFWSDAWYGGPPGYYYPYLFAYQPRPGYRHRMRHTMDEFPMDESPIAGREPRERIGRDPAERRTFRDRNGESGAGSRRGDRGAPRPRRPAAGAATTPN